jgi:hypothetical protein
METQKTDQFQNTISQESKKLSEMVKDPGLTLVDRIESYEDIINI